MNKFQLPTKLLVWPIVIRASSPCPICQAFFSPLIDSIPTSVNRRSLLIFSIKSKLHLVGSAGCPLIFNFQQHAVTDTLKEDIKFTRVWIAIAGARVWSLADDISHLLDPWHFWIFSHRNHIAFACLIVSMIFHLKQCQHQASRDEELWEKLLFTWC